MRGLNRVTLVGNLGREPEIKELRDGVAVAKFPVATTEVYRLKDGESKADTQWHTVVLWRSLATLAATYLKKGSLVLVEGRLRYRSYEEEGVGVRYVAEIIADRLLMLDKRVAAPTDNDSADSSDIGLPF
jgi:single-strand DNA-binding protein